MMFHRLGILAAAIAHASTDTTSSVSSRNPVLTHGVRSFLVDANFKALMPLAKMQRLYVYEISREAPAFNKFQLAPDYVRHLRTLPPIPKVLHCSWRNKDILKSRNSLVLNGLLNEVEMNPDWEYKIWTDDEIDAYIKRLIPASDWAFMRTKRIVERVDLWRLLVMYNEGGFYMDIDRYYNIPLSELIGAHTRMLLPRNRWDFSQDIMCTSPCNLAYLYAAYVLLDTARHEPAVKNETDPGERFMRIMMRGPWAYNRALAKVMFGWNNDNPNYEHADEMDKMVDGITSSASLDGSALIHTMFEEDGATLIFNKTRSGWRERAGDSRTKEQLLSEAGVVHWLDHDGK